jgi:hypothetical protein
MGSEEAEARSRRLNGDSRVSADEQSLDRPLDALESALSR